MATLPFETFAAEVGRVLGVSPTELAPDLDLYDGLGIDSLGLITIGDHLEKVFAIKFPAADVVTCRRLSEFHELTDRLIRHEDVVPADARARLLLGPDVSTDPAELAHLAALGGYATLDTASPTARYRGTFLTPAAGGGLEVVAFQRNIIQVQKMDSSLPTVLRGHLDADGRITAFWLTDTFAGSRGVLCYRPYLNRRLQTLLVGRRLDEVPLGELTSSNFGCFHVAEVVSDLVSAHQVRAAQGLSTFFEQECLDSVQVGDSLRMHGTQEIRGLGEVSYRIEIDSLFSQVHFDDNGGIHSRTPLRMRTYLGAECVADRVVGGATPPEFLLSLQRGTRSLLRSVGQALKVTDPPLMCSNLAAGLVGAIVLAISSKLYPNNYVYILHCLSGLQRQGGQPRCLGGVQTQAEADTHFSGFRVKDAVLGR
jgi:acyl carrier protein